MESAAAASTRSIRPRLPNAAAVIGLAALIFALHGRSLSYGLFLDDHAHFKQLRESDWSLGGLADACRLELVGGVIQVWWLPDCTLRFFRPVAFGLMKLTYTLANWDAAAMHAASLSWHLVACTLLMFLLRHLGASPGMSWVMAALFAIHPAHVATVQWIACQSELMVTVFLLAATLCTFRYRACASADQSEKRTNRSRGVAWLAATALFFGLALGCRENAIMFPLVIAALDLPMLRKRVPAAWPFYAVLGFVAAGYLAVRFYYLGGAAIPPRPYVVPPSAADFPRYILDKFCYYMLGEFAAVPCVPLGGLAYFREHLLLFYASVGAIVAILAVLWLSFGRRRPGPIAPLWLLAFMLPVLPAFESPHHLYLPGVGWALLGLLVFRGIAGSDEARSGWADARRAARSVAALFTFGVFALLNHFFGLALDTGQRVEDRILDEVITAPTPVQSGDTLYFANLPLLGHYVKLMVEREAGLTDLNVVLLTWAPRVLGVQTAAELKWVADRSIELRIADDRYLAGPLGRLTREARGGGWPFDQGRRLRQNGLGVELIEGDQSGIAALRFTFDKPPGEPGVHLFWGSRTRWATQVRP